MDLNTIFGVHEHALKLRVQRAEILSSNLINADTPGYRAKDIDFENTLKRYLENDQINKGENPNHVSFMQEVNAPKLIDAPSAIQKDDGNTVESHIENGKLAENNVRYLMALRIIEHKINSVLTSIKGE